ERPRHHCAAEERDELAPFHSITWSARPRSGIGIVRPSVLAVLRLIANSKVGRLGAFEDFPRVDADLAICIHKTFVVAHQAAGRHEFAPSVDCRNAMACRQRHELTASAIEEVVGADEKCIGSPATSSMSIRWAVFMVYSDFFRLSNLRTQLQSDYGHTWRPHD